MHKRTERALRDTRFTPESHPALVALVDFAAQHPGIEPCRYRNWTRYQTEVYHVSLQWRTICDRLRLADYYALSDTRVIAASAWADAGRLTWTGSAWAYRTGPDWPTAYRGTVIAVLRYALPPYAGRALR